MNAKDLLDIDKIKEIERTIRNRIRKSKKVLRRERNKENNRKYKGRVPRSYFTYLKSPYWSKRKNQYYQKYGRKCEVCLSTGKIQLHHKVYGDYGFEKDYNLVALCGFHHEQLHLAIGKTRRDMFEETNLLIEEMKQHLKLFPLSTG